MEHPVRWGAARPPERWPATRCSAGEHSLPCSWTHSETLAFPRPSAGGGGVGGKERGLEGGGGTGKRQGTRGGHGMAGDGPGQRDGPALARCTAPDQGQRQFGHGSNTRPAKTRTTRTPRGGLPGPRFDGRVGRRHAVQLPAMAAAKGSDHLESWIDRLHAEEEEDPHGQGFHLPSERKEDGWDTRAPGPPDRRVSDPRAGQQTFFNEK